MSIKRRLARLESDAPDPKPASPEGPRPAEVIGEHDKLIARLGEHIRKEEADPEGYDEGYDEAYYGESFESHEKRVDKLLKEADEFHEGWRREHRPDLAGVPEIDRKIAEVEAEIRRELEEGGGGA